MNTYAKIMLMNRRRKIFERVVNPLLNKYLTDPFGGEASIAKDIPMKYADKVKHVRKMFPKHARNILINKKIINPFFALAYLYDQGVRKVILVAGSDRVDECKIRYLIIS